MVAIPDEERATQYTPVVSTTVFEVGFVVFEIGAGEEQTEEIKVYLDNVEQVGNWTLDATFAGGECSTAEVVFGTGVTGTVDIVGERRPRRTAQFTAGPVSAAALNLVYNILTANLREIYDRISGVFTIIGDVIDFGGKRTTNAAQATTSSGLVTKLQMENALAFVASGGIPSGAVNVSYDGGGWSGGATVDAALDNAGPRLVTAEADIAALEAASIAEKNHVRVRTTANVTIATALNNADTIDGVALVTGERVLVMAQTAPEENGVWVVGVSPARAGDYDTYNEHCGSIIFVDEGSLYRDTAWVCTSDRGGTLNTTALTFAALADIIQKMPAGQIFGLTLSNNAGDATNDIDIAAGKARDSTDASNLVLAAALTKRLDAAWAVGSGNGGLDTGAIANTTYHIWLIKRTDTGVVDALFSASASAPTMPANYDYKRRIGSIVRTGGALKAFTQFGDEFLWDAAVVDINAANPGTSAVTRTLTLPVGIVVEALITAGTYGDTSRPAPVVSALSVSDQAPQTPSTASLTGFSTFGPSDFSASLWDFSSLRVRTNTSAQIRSRQASSGASDRFGIITRGWIDTRGRHA